MFWGRLIIHLKKTLRRGSRPLINVLFPSRSNAFDTWIGEKDDRREDQWKTDVLNRRSRCIRASGDNLDYGLILGEILETGQPEQSEHAAPAAFTAAAIMWAVAMSSPFHSITSYLSGSPVVLIALQCIRISTKNFICAQLSSIPPINVGSDKPPTYCYIQRSNRSR